MVITILRSEGAEPEKKKVEIIDPSRGIVVSDELTFGTVDIRERKIELKVEATTGTAQDRLKRKLEQNTCITNVSNGKVRGDGGRKSFDMTMDNACYYAVPEEEQAAAAEGGPAEGEKG